eukprot:gene3151-biopygen17167
MARAWRGHGAGMARAWRGLQATIWHEWRGRGAGVAQAFPVPPFPGFWTFHQKDTASQNE